MDVELSGDKVGSRKAPAAAADALPRLSSRDQLIRKLAIASQAGHMSASLVVLNDYVGASHFLLARYDLVQEHGLDFVVSSNWPFDLVRRLESEIAATYSRSTELDKCISVLQPKFGLLPDDAAVPAGISRQYCSLTVSVGRTRFALMLLFEENFVLSPELLREVGLLAGYCISLSTRKAQKSDRDFELTERELECLFWIAEGKTSDEIATILGISRNTINNYITSVMRKTATKTRSEAIAYAVRNNLV
ncbi:LuxR family transcriptional regulator [Rhizobium sp. KAs_5_22]|uniref:transcriptional regulator VisN n=1 Tax=Ciceribacter selenitireducens TaxID=448181 RepID=UPI00048E0CBB|nr:LuxR C-terminal-related transcriptional regulator [Ciceribacter selenitireducens]PPJ47818.1 LuxR family transcriptional regulator [Rhizobium sp. KAs_5_22]